MILLLDTHLLLWAAGHAERLSNEARQLLDDPQNELAFSAASLWEIAIKRGLNREDFRVNPRVLRRALLDNDYQELPVRSEHALEIDTLPPLHKDPFDRLLLAQVQVEGMLLLTTDAQLLRYSGSVRKVSVQIDAPAPGG